MTDEQVKQDAIGSEWVDYILEKNRKYSSRNCINELDVIINSLTKAIEKGDNLQLGIVLGQSLTELKKIKQNLLFA